MYVANFGHLDYQSFQTGKTIGETVANSWNIQEFHYKDYTMFINVYKYSLKFTGHEQERRIPAK